MAGPRSLERGALRLLISLIICLCAIIPAQSVSYRITYSPGQKDRVSPARAQPVPAAARCVAVARGRCDTAG